MDETDKVLARERTESVEVGLIDNLERKGIHGKGDRAWRRGRDEEGEIRRCADQDKDTGRGPGCVGGLHDVGRVDGSDRIEGGVHRCEQRVRLRSREIRLQARIPRVGIKPSSVGLERGTPPLRHPENVRDGDRCSEQSQRRISS